MISGMKTKNINVGILGGSFCCPNFGVGALTISQCKILDNIAEQISSKIKVICYEACIQNAYIPRFENLEIVLDTHCLNVGIMKKKISRHEVIIDLYGGDSFSDIYSVKGFIIGCNQRLMAINEKQKYILAPQTIGPFKNFLSKYYAKRLMKRVNHIFLRDRLSLNMVPLELQEKTTCVTDLAFRLPYNKMSETEVKIGLNVSGLLWQSSLLKEKSEVYKAAIKKIITYCLEKKISLVLVPHVNDANNTIDGDYAVSRELCKEFNEKIQLASVFSNPIDAKSYISQFSMFIGSRMHATIASSSIGIPTLAIAYSKKFEGVFDSLGYPYTIKKDDMSVNLIMEKFEYILAHYDEVKKMTEDSRNKASVLLEQYDSYLLEILKDIS